MKRYYLLIALTICILGVLTCKPNMALTQGPQSTSSSVNSVSDPIETLEIHPQSGVITFSEYPIGTSISNQYANQGIIFSGDSPFITTDGANPTSPVLSGSPRFEGAIEGSFVDSSDGTTPIIVESFTLDAGYFDAFGSTRIEWFDPDGNKLGQRTNSQFGIETFEIEGGNIARWRIAIIENEPAGYAIDNISFEPVQASVLFREKREGDKDGTWGFLEDEIPGFDHTALQVDNLVYESHPGNVKPGTVGTFYSEDGQETATIGYDNGVQAQHTKETFKHDAMSSGAANSPVIDFEEIPIDIVLAESMRDHINTQTGAAFQYIDFSIFGLQQTLSPSAQKGGDGTFTCVGLVEWAAEQAGHNGGQGFIWNKFESITIVEFLGFPLFEFPLLSPELLNHSMKFSLTLDDVTQWFQGIFDPVDFIITDPLGRRLGYTDVSGEINEIPRAFYSGNGKVEQFLIPNPVAGIYQIEFTGLGDQVYGAMESSLHSEGVNVSLAQGEEITETFTVEMKTSAPGDVNQDGCINEQDTTELLALLNTFTNDPNHPADIDGNGIIGQSDLTLLNELIALNLSCAAPPNQIFIPIILKTSGGGGDTYEPNDTPATSYGPLSPGTTYQSYIWTANDYDGYYINVTSLNPIIINLTNIPAGTDYELDLYDENVNWLDSSYNIGNTDEYIYFTPTTTGRYYILVYSYDGYNTTQPYSLHIGFNGIASTESLSSETSEPKSNQKENIGLPVEWQSD